MSRIAESGRLSWWHSSHPIEARGWAERAVADRSVLASSSARLCRRNPVSRAKLPPVGACFENFLDVELSKSRAQEHLFWLYEAVLSGKDNDLYRVESSWFRDELRITSRTGPCLILPNDDRPGLLEDLERRGDAYTGGRFHAWISARRSRAQTRKLPEYDG